jgi:putative transposase
MSRTKKYYNKKMPIKDQQILLLILSVLKSSRKGRNKIIRMVKRLDPNLSSSRIRRVYEQNGMSLPHKPKKRLSQIESKPLKIPLSPMQDLGIDFMSDCLEDGRKIRTLNIIDHFNRMCLGIFVAFSFPSVNVIECLERVFSIYGTPKSIRTDNGPEFTSKRFEIWLRIKGIEHIRIQPGKPAQNGIIERFNRTYREDILDSNLIFNLDQLRTLTADWIKEYNEERPHQSLKYATPKGYAA